MYVNCIWTERDVMCALYKPIPSRCASNPRHPGTSFDLLILRDSMFPGLYYKPRHSFDTRPGGGTWAYWLMYHICMARTEKKPHIHTMQQCVNTNQMSKIPILDLKEMNMRCPRPYRWIHLHPRGWWVLVTASFEPTDLELDLVSYGG